MGAKRLYLISVFFMLVIFALHLASASIAISQPNALYNLGDRISMEINIDSITTGYLEVNLVCPETVENIYQDVPASTAISITRELTPAFINNSHGECHLVTNYAEESVLSQNFQISNSIDVIVSNANLGYIAGEPINVKGTAYKNNGKLVGQEYKAYVEVIMSEEIKVKGEVKDSQFDVNFKAPENMKKGDYTLTVKVTEEDSRSNVLSSGQTSFAVTIKQIPSKIDIAMDRASINPGENVTLIPTLYNLAGEIETGKISFVVQDTSGNVVYDGLVDSNQKVILQTKTTNPAGTSKVIAKKDSISAERFFQINELKKVSAQIINKSMVITNIGNVPYSGTIEVTMNGEKTSKKVELELGESKMFQIEAPDGTYDIGISDSGLILNENGVALTGSAITIKDTKNALNNIIFNYPIVWIFLIIIVAMFIWVYYKRYLEGRRFNSIPSQGFSGSRISETEKKRGGIEVINPELINKKIEEKVFDSDIRRAEQLTVLHGLKQPVSIIAIKTKNGISGISKQTMHSALESAYKKKAVSYSSGDYVLLIFSPLVTRTMANEETAIKTAIEIDNQLKEHNRKFRNDTISYGIGVNNGEIINKMAGKILQFTNISNTINLAKRIAEASNNDVLLSKHIHEKTMNNIKAEKAMAGSLEAFSIKRVVDKEKSEKFINEFMRRNTVK